MRKLLLGLTCLALAPGAAPAQETPAALVVRLQGEVRIRHGDAAPSGAAVGERLQAGDAIMPASGARAFLVLRTGATQVVTENTTLEEPSGEGNPDMFSRAMRVLAQAATTDASTISARQGMIRPIPGEPVLVAPRNGLTVSSTRPTFNWLAVPGATEYMIQIRRIDGGRPVRYRTGPDTTWTLPPDAPALLPGATYAWTVAPGRGRPTREQRFRVIGAEEYRQLEENLATLSDMGLPPEGEGLLFTAMLYRDLNLLYDAEAILDTMDRNTTPMSAELYLLKGDILASLGRAREAREAFDKADEMMR